MAKHTHLSSLARLALVDVNVVAMTIDPALEAIDRETAGWPSTSVGAGPAAAPPATVCTHPECTLLRPCPDHDAPDVELTATERNADTIDRAALQGELLKKHVKQVAHHAAIAAQIAQNWAWQGLNESAVKARLTAIDASIWCENCSKFGRHEPREQGRKECRDCANFRRDYKRTMSKPFWDAKDARNGRLDVGTIERILKRVKAEEKVKQAEQKAAAKAEREARNTTAA